MCVYSFDMCFTFVMTGWEGTANNSRVLLETVHNPENKFPMPPLGIQIKKCVIISYMTLVYPYILNYSFREILSR